MLAFRAFRGDEADYQILAEIVNADVDELTSAEEIRLADGRFGPEGRPIREFAVADGQCVGWFALTLLDPNGMSPAAFARFNFLPSSRSERHIDQIVERLEDTARRHRASPLSIIALEHLDGAIAALDRRGFVPARAHILSRMDLAAVSTDILSEFVRAIEGQGFTIRSAAELEIAGVDWLSAVHELYLEVLGDESMPSLEEFREQHVGKPYHAAELEVVAFEGERAVGASKIALVPGRSDIVRTVFTCVRPSHTRRGMATGLKAAAALSAKRCTFQVMTTINEENNPMLRANLKLGFRQTAVERTFRKVFE